MAMSGETEPVRVLIIGAGPGGLAMGHHLQQAGIEDFVLVERLDGVGGTWRINTYPGAECDVPSHLYSFSFRLNPGWSKSYAAQPEILEYFETFAGESGLIDHLRSGTEVVTVVWDEKRRRWTITAADGRSWSAQHVVSAVGTFNDPLPAELPGIGSFAGPVIHSARWDHGVDLVGRRVAVVGTGASAIQIVPELAEVVDHLDVYQRTAPWVLPRNDVPFSPQQQEAFAADPGLMATMREEIERFYLEAIPLRVGDPRAEVLAAIGRAHLESSVTDPELRARLEPGTIIGCKRILVSDTYYPALQRPNVDLVTDPIREVVAEGIITEDGMLRPVDVIVAATGFRATDYLAGIEVIGRSGESLHQRWGDEPRAYLGMAVPGFPNFFVMYGPNTNQAGNSILVVLEAQARYISQWVTGLESRGGSVSEVSDAAFLEDQRRLDEEMRGTVWSHCGSYFRTATGHIATQMPVTSREYERRVAEVDWTAFVIR
jgi:cation diffusion facilitator CzcD-associated flavoprotein CzcO